MQTINLLEGLGNIFLPQHVGDAGYDLVAACDPEIIGDQNEDGTWNSIQYIEYDTSVAIAPENYEDTFALVFPRSSISKYNLTLANSVGVVDGGYRGHIKLRFRYVVQPQDLEWWDGRIVIGSLSNIYQKGDRVGQLIFCKKQDVLLNATTAEHVSERSSGGFGSTGK